jgi:hypothetical protein
MRLASDAALCGNTFLILAFELVDLFELLLAIGSLISISEQGHSFRIQLPSAYVICRVFGHAKSQQQTAAIRIQRSRPPIASKDKRCHRNQALSLM